MLVLEQEQFIATSLKKPHEALRYSDLLAQTLLLVVALTDVGGQELTIVGPRRCRVENVDLGRVLMQHSVRQEERVPVAQGRCDRFGRFEKRAQVVRAYGAGVLV